MFIRSKKGILTTSTLKKSGQEHGASQVMCMSVQQLAWKCLHNTLVLWNISVCHTPVELNPREPSPRITVLHPGGQASLCKQSSIFMNWDLYGLLILQFTFHAEPRVSSLWEYIEVRLHFSTYPINGFKNLSGVQTWSRKKSQHISHTLNRQM